MWVIRGQETGLSWQEVYRNHTMQPRRADKHLRTHNPSKSWSAPTEDQIRFLSGQPRPGTRYHDDQSGHVSSAGLWSLLPFWIVNKNSFLFTSWIPTSLEISSISMIFTSKRSFEPSSCFRSFSAKSATWRTSLIKEKTGLLKKVSEKERGR